MFLSAERIDITRFLEQDETCLDVVDILNTLTSFHFSKQRAFYFFVFKSVVNTTLKYDSLIMVVFKNQKSDFCPANLATWNSQNNSKFCFSQNFNLKEMKIFLDNVSYYKFKAHFLKTGYFRLWEKLGFHVLKNCCSMRIELSHP